MAKEEKKEYMRKYYAANKEKLKEVARKYYVANKEKTLERTRKWQEVNKEKSLEVSRKWREVNKEKEKARSTKKSALDTKDLRDPYIRAKLRRQGFEKEQITPELIELKRITIKTHRLCRQLKN